MSQNRINYPTTSQQAKRITGKRSINTLRPPPLDHCSSEQVIYPCSESSTLGSRPYRPTTRSMSTIDHYKPANIISALIRLFAHNVPQDVASVMETISLTPPDSPSWSIIEWDEISIDKISDRCNYVLSDTQRSDLLTIMGIARLFNQPTSGIPEQIQTAVEVHQEPLEMYEMEVKPRVLQAHAPKFTTLTTWDNLLWSASTVFTVTYSARNRRWSEFPTTPVGQYRMSLTVNTDGSAIWSATGQHVPKDDTTYIDIRHQGPLSDFSIDILVEKPFTMVFAVPNTQVSDMYVLVKIASAMRGGKLGRDEPMWVTDHRQLANSPRAGSHKKDLTTEGIEPNPGPNYIIDRLVAQGKINRDMLPMIATVELATANRFSIFSTMLDIQPYTDPDWTELESGPELIPQRPTSTKRPSSDHGEGSANNPISKRNTSKGPTLAEKVQQRAAVISRIGRKFGSDPLYAANLIRNMSSFRPRFLREIASMAWGLAWDVPSVLTHQQYAVWSYLNRVPPDDILFVTLEPWVSSLKKKDAFDLSLYEKAFFDIASSSYREVMARAHNKSVHALNGNIFSSTMSDVDQAPNFWSFVETNEPPNISMISADKNIVLANISTNNYALQAGNDASGLRADVVTRSGTSMQSMLSIYPFSGIQLVRSPKLWISADGTCLATAMPRRNGSRYFSCRLVDYYTNTLKATTMAIEINNQIATHGVYKARASDSTQSGFSMADIMDVAAIQVPQGLSLERPVVAALMLHSAIRHSKFVNIPPTAFTYNSDQIIYSDEEQLQFDWYAPEISSYPDDAQYATVFPFSGVPGKLRFHTTLQTVPRDRRASALIIPMGILTDGTDPNKNLAMLMMMVAEWPFFLATWRVKSNLDNSVTWRIPTGEYSSWATAFSADTSRPPIMWQLNHALTTIPGLTEVDVVLPRQYASNVPRTAGEAAIQSEVIPKSGPHAVIRGEYVYPASQEIGINYASANAVDKVTNFCDYLNSWLPEISEATINTLLANFNSHFNIANLSAAASDIVVMMTQRAPPLLNTQAQIITEYKEPKNTEPSGSRYSRISTAVAEASLPSDGPPGPTPPPTPTFKNAVVYSDIIHTEASDLYTPMLLSTKIVETNSYEANGYPKLTVPYPKYDKESMYTIVDFNMQAWNKVVIGLATSDEFSPGDLLPIIPLLTDKMAIHAETHRAIKLATPVQLMVSDIGATSKFYEAPSSYNTYPDLRQTILAFGITTAQPRSLEVAPMSNMLNKVYAGIYSSTLPKRATLMGDRQVLVSVYGRSHYTPMPQVWNDHRDQGIATNDVLDSHMDKALLFCPALLPDIWLHVFANRLPKRAMSFPIPYGLNGPAGYADNLVPRRFADNTITPRHSRALSLDYYPSNSLPENNDETQWNVRLFVTEVGELIRWRWCDSTIPADWFNPSRLPCPIMPANGPWSTAGQPYEYNWCTTALPIVDENARRVYPVAPMSRANTVALAEVRNTRLPKPVWAIGNPQISNPLFQDQDTSVSRFAQVFRVGASSAAQESPPADRAQMETKAPPNETTQMPVTVEQVTTTAGDPPIIPVAQQ